MLLLVIVLVVLLPQDELETLRMLLLLVFDCVLLSVVVLELDMNAADALDDVDGVDVFLSLSTSTST